MSVYTSILSCPSSFFKARSYRIRAVLCDLNLNYLLKTLSADLVTLEPRDSTYELGRGYTGQSLVLYT